MKLNLDLHCCYTIESTSFIDEYEPLEEGLLPVSEKRIVSSLLVKLRVDDAGTLSREQGYMPPKQVDREAEQKFLRNLEGYTLRREERKQYRYDGHFGGEYEGRKDRDRARQSDAGYHRDYKGGYGRQRDYGRSDRRDYRDYRDYRKDDQYETQNWRDERKPYRDDKREERDREEKPYPRRDFRSNYRDDRNYYTDDRRDYKDERRDEREERQEFVDERREFRGHRRDDREDGRDYRADSRPEPKERTDYTPKAEYRDERRNYRGRGFAGKSDNHKEEDTGFKDERKTEDFNRRAREDERDHSRKPRKPEDRGTTALTQKKAIDPSEAAASAAVGGETTGTNLTNASASS